jgi:hypothetical protein
LRRRNGARGQPLDRSAIRDALAAGAFLSAAAAYLFATENSEKAPFDRDAVSLHNDSEIDLLEQALLFEAAASELEEFELFEFFGRVFPALNSDAGQMIEAVGALGRRGSDRGMGYGPMRGFQKWCATDLDRAEAAISLLSDGRFDPFGLLTYALQGAATLDAPGYFQRAITLGGSPHEDVAAGALLAIGLIEQDVPPDLVRAAGDWLQTFVRAGAPDRLLSLAIEAALRLRAKGGIADQDFVALLEAARGAVGPQTLFRLSYNLWEQWADLPAAALDPILAMLLEVGAEQGGTIANVDRSLARMLDSAQRDRAMAFVEDLLRANRGAIELKALDRVIRHLRTDVGGRNALVIRWFMSGDQTLARAVVPLVGRASDNPERLDIDFSGQAFTAAEAGYCARKAIGHLFLNPITAASILVSLLRHLDGDAAQVVADLLFDPLLINYSGRLRRELEPLAASDDPAAQHVAAALARLEDYGERLRACREISELAPSTRERMIEHYVKADSANRAFKEASKKSIFANIFAEMVLLHGHRMITYVLGPNGKRRRIENKLGVVSKTMETPRELATNPHGLDTRLMMFRLERRP